MNQHSQPKYAIRPIVPETVYTNRNEPLNYLYQTALNAIERRSMSVVLFRAAAYGKDRNHGSGSGGTMRRKPVLYHGSHSAISRAEQPHDR